MKDARSHHELRIRYPFSDQDIITLLKELLEILVFTHQFGVIHRDIKPSNVIRRKSDQKLVLIDFGAVKEIQGQLTDDMSKQTVAIGTHGYMPNEQLAGSPRFNSDIYAVGIIGIHASTKLSPEKLIQDIKTGELVWWPHSNHSDELKNILFKMTRYDFRDRYQSVQEVIEDLDALLVQGPAYEHGFSTSEASTTASKMSKTRPQLSAEFESDKRPLLANGNYLEDLENELDDEDERYFAPTLPWPQITKPVANMDDGDDDSDCSGDRDETHNRRLQQDGNLENK